MSLAFGPFENPRSPCAVDVTSKLSCMIVEDQALIGLALEAYLEDAGLHVFEPLSSGAAALK